MPRRIFEGVATYRCPGCGRKFYQPGLCPACQAERIPPAAAAGELKVRLKRAERERYRKLRKAKRRVRGRALSAGEIMRALAGVDPLQMGFWE